MKPKNNVLLEIDYVFYHYTLNELSSILEINSWDLLQKFKDNSLDKNQVDKIRKIYKELKSKEESIL